MPDSINWLNITDEQLEAGLVERRHVTVNLLTGVRNNRVIPGSVLKIRNLDESLRTAFADWWKTGVVPDISEPGGLNLKKLVDGDGGQAKMSVIGAFFDLDQVIKHPSERRMITNGLHDKLSFSSVN